MLIFPLNKIEVLGKVLEMRSSFAACTSEDVVSGKCRENTRVYILQTKVLFGGRQRVNRASVL